MITHHRKALEDSKKVQTVVESKVLTKAPTKVSKYLTFSNLNFPTDLKNLRLKFCENFKSTIPIDYSFLIYLENPTDFFQNRKKFLLSFIDYNVYERSLFHSL